MIAAVLFDLDETLLDRTTSLVAFLDDQYRRFADQLGAVLFTAWRDRFLALDNGGHVHKSIVYPKILLEFGGNPDAASLLLNDYLNQCCIYARMFPGAKQTLDELRKR